MQSTRLKSTILKQQNDHSLRKENRKKKLFFFFFFFFWNGPVQQVIISSLGFSEHLSYNKFGIDSHLSQGGGMALQDWLLTAGSWLKWI